MEGRVIADRFEIRALIGRGGMSEVWLGHDRELGRPVAVKVCAPNVDRVRFEREARAVADLSHGNITRVYDFGVLGDHSYLILEYAPGGTLEERLRQGTPLPDDESARIAEDLASALTHAHAHAKLIVHRDVKPSNVVFDGEGRAKLGDFGLARSRYETTLTEPGTILGTAAYMSPEQAAGERAGPASDVYSFGVLLFQMLTGRLPFAAETPIEAAARRLQEQAPPVRAVRSDAPALLARVADRALAREPSQRPADGAALAAELTGASPFDAPTEPVGAATIPLATPRASPSHRRRPVAVTLAGLAAAGAAVGLLVGGGDGSGTTDPPSRHATNAGPTSPTATEPGRTPTAPPSRTNVRRTIHPQPPDTDRKRNDRPKHDKQAGKRDKQARKHGANDH